MQERNGYKVTKTIAYGAFASPITSSLITAATVGLDEVHIDGADIYFVERRPSENGRSVIVCQKANGSIADVTPPGYNVRTMAHEYGGGSYTVLHETVYFSNLADSSLYMMAPFTAPKRITYTDQMRYADLVVDHIRNRLLCVREDHAKGSVVQNTIVSVNLQDGEETILAQGHDFYSSISLSPDGRQMAFLTWDHPNMPWDGTELWVSTFDTEGNFALTEKVVGGIRESIFSPKFAPDGSLLFVSDRTDWWNLYRYENKKIHALYPQEAEYGRAQWVFGMSTYAFCSDTHIVSAYCTMGMWNMALMDYRTGDCTEIETPYTSISHVQAYDGTAVFIGESATKPTSVVMLDMDTNEVRVVRQSSIVAIDDSYLSVPETIEFPTVDRQTAYAFYYPPKNNQVQTDPQERPPLLVISHGGPTSATEPTFDLRIQYFTSRGIGVLDVNYGGSTGYGRTYRERLKGNWGIVDVDDCISGAQYLVERGDVDGKRLAIRGGSAGGYTTLCSLTFRDVFAVGASYYGVSDAQALATDTHKFESRYLDGLIGPYPEKLALYRERSPIHFAQQLTCPVIFFQGLDDKVVPPSQAQVMVDELRQKGLPVAYIAFAGEGHGFRQRENIKRCLDAEIFFYGKVLGFTPHDEIEPVEIANL